MLKLDSQLDFHIEESYHIWRYLAVPKTDC